MPKISRAKLLAAATTVVVLLLACNLELLPLALLLDTIGLDVLACCWARNWWLCCHGCGRTRRGHYASSALGPGPPWQASWAATSGNCCLADWAIVDKAGQACYLLPYSNRSSRQPSFTTGWIASTPTQPSARFPLSNIVGCPQAPVLLMSRPATSCRENASR